MFRGVRISEFLRKTTLHPRGRHLHIAMLFLDIWTTLFLFIHPPSGVHVHLQVRLHSLHHLRHLRGRRLSTCVSFIVSLVVIFVIVIFVIFIVVIFPFVVFGYSHIPVVATLPSQEGAAFTGHDDKQLRLRRHTVLAFPSGIIRFQMSCLGPPLLRH